MCSNCPVDNSIPQLVMLRPDLEDLNDLILPKPYKIRSEVKGDDKAWEKIIAISFKETFPYSMMTEDKAYRPERVFFVTDEKDVPIATASAWTVPIYPADCAVLHMVGILPEHSGHHLGLHVSLAAMKQAKKEGFTRIALKTDDFRIPAIKIYLRLGFMPVVVHESHIDIWKGVFNKIGREDLLAFLPSVYDGTTTETL